MKHIALAFLLFVFLLAGCSGGVTPTTPDTENASGNSESLPIIGGMMSEDGSFNATGVLGSYELVLNPEDMSADLVSKRIPAALGNSWIVSGMSFFTMAPCGNCLMLNSITLTPENYMKLNFKIKHPFAPGVSTLPPSAKNRLDLDIFDTAMVVIPKEATPTAYALMGVSAYTGVLANNAGYTTELANVVGDNAAMPYALVVDKNAEPAAADWNEFPMGAESFFDVYFDLGSSSSVAFDLYLTFGYGASAQGKSQRLTPTYFNPEFNRKAAWKVVVTPPNGSDVPAMSNTWNDSNNTDLWPVTVSIFDWQQGVTTIANPPVVSGDIAAESNVAGVTVEIPGMNAAPQAGVLVGGTGGFNDPIIYEANIANELDLPMGEYVGIVKVADTRVPPNPVAGIDHMIDTPDGILLNNYVIPEFATYQTFKATVVQGCGPITGNIVSPSCPVSSLANGSKVNFVVNATSANGGNPIVLYEVDYDYDGVTFTADFSNTTGTFNNVGPFTVPDPCNSNIPKTFKVAFRATDSCPTPNVTIFSTCDVTVDSCFVWFKETFNSNPADWAYAYYQYWSGCSNTTVAWSSNAPFGPSGSGNVRYPTSGNTTNGGDVQTVVTPPFAVPTGYANVYLRVYVSCAFGGSYGGYYCQNWKIVESSTPGLAPFLNTGALPSGAAHLQNSTANGSAWPVYTANIGAYGQMAGQPGWGAGGGGAFPGSLTAYFDLIIPASFYGKTVKVCYQWVPDWCGYTGSGTGFALDDFELWAP